MPKFMFIYRGGCDDLTDATPEEMQNVLKEWTDWITKGMEAGWMLDGGNALQTTGAVLSPDMSVTDGPFAESKELVGGYSMVQADNLASAVELAKGCPATNTGSKVEVRELVVFDNPEG